ncbi:hypothetical protein CYY_002859 [Polysphondylium violaceum]|uniref:Phospholipid/glycerol acyltransferase domain-containing protein n=1 Tax=Polysphondylium violaceum TaxID=133409 RepID=A0A8J4V0K4_9MYCE|nr:hypothetical protein CYY_002859 [Polysphondylium violaceum]
MEKFSNWRDGPTGIHPLLPTKSKNVNVFDYIFKYVIGPLFGILRLPFVVLLTLLLVLFDTLTRMIPVGVISRVLNRFFTIIFARWILFAMGYFKIEESTETLSRSKKAAGSIGTFKMNDVIICNHSSYVDIIYLAYRFSPTFAVPPNDRDPTTFSARLIPLNIAQALKNAIFSPLHLNQDSVDTKILMEKITNSWSGPLVILPEGTTSNGQGLLDISPVFESDSGIKSLDFIHVLGITYHYGMYSPCYSSVGSVWLHLFKLCSQVSNGIQIKYLSRSCIPPLPDLQAKSIIISSKSSSVVSELQEWFDNVFKALSSMINTRRTKINSHDKLSFVAYWKGYKVVYDKKNK